MGRRLRWLGRYEAGMTVNRYLYGYATSAGRFADPLVESGSPAGGAVREKAGHGNHLIPDRSPGVRGYPEEILKGREAGSHAYRGLCAVPSKRILRARGCGRRWLATFQAAQSIAADGTAGAGEFPEGSYPALFREWGCR